MANSYDTGTQWQYMLYTIENNFNVKQLEGEKEKRLFLQDNPEKAETLFIIIKEKPSILQWFGGDHLFAVRTFVIIYSDIIAGRNPRVLPKNLRKIPLTVEA